MDEIKPTLNSKFSDCINCPDDLMLDDTCEFKVSGKIKSLNDYEGKSFTLEINELEYINKKETNDRNRNALRAYDKVRKDSAGVPFVRPIAEPV